MVTVDSLFDHANQDVHTTWKLYHYSLTCLSNIITLLSIEWRYTAVLSTWVNMFSPLVGMLSLSVFALFNIIIQGQLKQEE